MKTPAWLAEFHRQWYKARGKKLQLSARPFSRRWEKLLDDAGLRLAAERSNAQAEAAALQAEGRLELRTHRYRRYLIESVVLPPAAELWLVALFDGKPARDLVGQAISLAERFQAAGHRRWPEAWQRMCEETLAAFKDGRNHAPFSWSDTEELEDLFSTLHKLTEHDWAAGTLIREASKKLGFESKNLEEKQGVLESALHRLFGEKTGLEALGISCVQSRVTIHGPLILYFEGAKAQHFEHLRGDITITFSDLQRCTHATTSAGRILTIENVKTPFSRAVAANKLGDTLLVASSFPNSATRCLLKLLPASLPHHHFGDTDVFGYAILKSLREIGTRPVQGFLMDWRDKLDSAPLSEHELRVLATLKASPLMGDCLPFLLEMERAGRKGWYEQEDLGPPMLNQWPFWER